MGCSRMINWKNEDMQICSQKHKHLLHEIQNKEFELYLRAHACISLAVNPTQPQGFLSIKLTAEFGFE